MSDNIIVNEPERRPVIVCPLCKRKNIVDISGFNHDITRIAKIKCLDCNRWIYMGLLLLANASQDSLFANIQTVVDAVNAKETLRVGDQGSIEGSKPKIIN